ncbi:MAG: hypothetical protein AB7N76_33815 [Planctomycetota bacterium]
MFEIVYWLFVPFAGVALFGALFAASWLQERIGPRPTRALVLLTGLGILTTGCLLSGRPGELGLGGYGVLLAGNILGIVLVGLAVVRSDHSLPDPPERKGPPRA